MISIHMISYPPGKYSSGVLSTKQIFNLMYCPSSKYLSDILSIKQIFTLYLVHRENIYLIPVHQENIYLISYPPSKYSSGVLSIKQILFVYLVCWLNSPQDPSCNAFQWVGQTCEMAQVVLLCEAWNLGETIIQRYLQLTSMEDNDAGPTSNSLPVMVLVGSYFTMYYEDQKICAPKPKVNTTSSRLCF